LARTFLISNAPAANAKGSTTKPRKIERPAIQARTDEPPPPAISGCAAFQDQPTFTSDKESHMEMINLQFLYDLLYAIGEILTTTWGGRVVLGIAIGCLISRLARA
jgi:hypothetical protein